MCTIARNEKFNSYELTFDGKPSENVREVLKANGYRWHKVRGIWYGYTDISAQLEERPTTAHACEEKAKATPIKFYYNGIKTNGSDKLIKCGYSLCDDGAVMIYADGYGDTLPGDLFTVQNDTDIYTDYFDNDSAIITTAHPLHRFALYYAKKAQYMQDKHILKRQEKNPRLYSYLTKEERLKRIKDFEKLPDVGQPTNADLLQVDEMNAKAQAKRKAEEEAEEQQAEKNYKQKKVFGQMVIEEAQRVFPLEAGATDYVIITFSEHCGFYPVLDESENGLKLSILAGDYLLRVFDERQHEDRNTQDGIGWYDKTDFTIYKDGEPVYSGRYDIGDGEGGLLSHVESLAKWYATHTPFGGAKDKATDEDEERLAFACWLREVIEADETVQSLDEESAEYQAYFN